MLLLTILWLVTVVSPRGQGSRAYPTGGTVFCLTHKDTFVRLKFVKSNNLFLRNVNLKRSIVLLTEWKK
jgi:hypothetical protein